MSLNDILDDLQQRPDDGEEGEMLREEAGNVLLRAQSHPGSISDATIIMLIEKLWEYDPVAPLSVNSFGTQIESLMKRLSFTGQKFHESDGAELKRAWTSFLNESNSSLGWPVNIGMAEWYEDTGMVLHAIALYEHLYTEVRGRRHDEHKDEWGNWLLTLLQLCRQQGLHSRARHLCEVMEDYHDDGVVSAELYADVILFQKDLKYRDLAGAFQEDRRLAQERLTIEHRYLLDLLHTRSRALVIDAELWSADYWRCLEPGLSPLNWSRAVEWEFHNKVYKRHQAHLSRIPTFHAPATGNTCSLGQIEFLLNNLNGSIGGHMFLAGLEGGAFLGSAEGRQPLQKMREHRGAIAHVRNTSYAAGQCQEYLAAIRYSGWIFKFLAAMQPRSGR